MKNSALLIVIVFFYYEVGAQSHLGLEQYFYVDKSQDVSLVCIGYYQNAQHWYGEVRYNYEDKKTMSVYFGKTFYKEGELYFAATPMLGLLAGQFTGGSLGMNLTVTLKKIILLSQLQYVCSTKDRDKNFILNWSEIKYGFFTFLKSGIVLQQSTINRSVSTWEVGALICFSYRNWELPVYVFSPAANNRNYVIGINWDWHHTKRSNNNQVPVPSLQAQRKSALE